MGNTSVQGLGHHPIRRAASAWLNTLMLAALPPGQLAPHGSREEAEPQRPLCKQGCGRPVAAGISETGDAHDTCCEACAKSSGGGRHDPTCCPRLGCRPVCDKGSRCHYRDTGHLQSFSHPLDLDYGDSCEVFGIEPETLTLKVVFDCADADGSGKLSRVEVENSLFAMQRVSGRELPQITNEEWKDMDEDGNGVVNFNEFASWAGPRLGLPLGLKAFTQRTNQSGSSFHIGGSAFPCGIAGCPCEAFVKSTFGWCRSCGHKRCRHEASFSISTSSWGEVDFPEYWQKQNGTFTQLVDMPMSVSEFQKYFNKTYKRTYTRDRRKHNPQSPNVPKNFKVVHVQRNENSNNWQEYYARRAEIVVRSLEGAEPIQRIRDVKTCTAFRECFGKARAKRLLPECNEWYLFHGTNPAAAKNICSSDFKVGSAGINTGTLYGRGLYFAESITKADEYAKPNEKGDLAVLLCRVLGGRVLYTDEETPDPDKLVTSCVEGPYDSVLGDREKGRNTFREFVIFDSEDVYPEYLIEYRRVY